MNNKVYIHSSSLCETDNIGSDTKIGAFCIIKSGVKIGRKCIIKDNVSIDSNTIIADNVIILSGTRITGYIKIENQVIINE